MFSRQLSELKAFGGIEPQCEGTDMFYREGDGHPDQQHGIDQRCHRWALYRTVESGSRGDSFRGCRIQQPPTQLKAGGAIWPQEVKWGPPSIIRGIDFKLDEHETHHKTHMSQNRHSTTRTQEPRIKIMKLSLRRETLLRDTIRYTTPADYYSLSTYNFPTNQKSETFCPGPAEH